MKASVVSSARSSGAADLDRTDRAILRCLQEDGRLSNAEIAARVNLSTAACWKRLKRLQTHVIQGCYTAVKPEALGLHLLAFVNVMLESDDKESMERFEAGIADLENVISCHNISGRYGYLLQVVVSDMEAFRDLHLNKIGSIVKIREIHSSFSIKEIKATAIPI